MEKPHPSLSWFGKRHIQCVLLFTCIVIEMTTRSSLSLAINAMTDSTTSTNPDVPTYNWTDNNVILSSFYWGYIVFQVPAGQLAKTYGARCVLLVLFTVNSVATSLIPLSASVFGSKGVMACRILQGLVQGGVFPSCHTMLGRWVPDSERGKMATFIYSGINVGAIICYPIVSWLSVSSWGWPASFYLFGAAGLMWCLVWSFYGQSSPASHPSISSDERLYIEKSLNQVVDEVVETPWMDMLTSIHFWSCLLPTVGAGYGIIFLQNEMPTYLQKVMGFDISSTGYVSSVTAGVAVLSSIVVGPLSDFLINNHFLSRLTSRKIFELTSCYGSAATLLGLAFMTKDHVAWSVFFFILSSVFGAGLINGHSLTPIDLSPRFAGIILAFCNSCASAIALLAPLSVHFMVTDETDAQQWRWVFIIAAIVFGGPATFYGFCASAEQQEWDKGRGRTEEEVREKV